MRRVDRLGRIVIPLEMREKYGLCEGTEIEFLDSGDGVTVRSTEPFCKLCRAKIDSGSNIPLCDNCIAEVTKLYSEKK
jgi:AbrB family looped-hinge helix DNA binding protein